MKNYLPFENYVLTTALSPDEVRTRLSNIIAPKKGFRLTLFKRTTEKPYEGEISVNSFCINRIIHYKNSFLPLIKGEIALAGDKTTIKIKMRPATFVLVFMSFWLGTVALVCLTILVMGVLRWKQILHSGFSPMLLIPYGMLLFGSLLSYFAFKTESKKSKAFISLLLEAESTLSNK